MAPSCRSVDVGVVSVGVNTDRVLVDVANTQHRLLRRSDVERAGVSSARWCRLVDAGTWLEVVPGVFCHAAVELTWELRVRAGACWLGHDSALFARTAAAWWQLDGFVPERVEFLVAHRRRFLPPRMEVHTTRQWAPGDLLVHRGLRITSVTRTVIDLARIGASARAIEAAIDSGVRRRLTSIPTLRRRIRQLAGRGHRGSTLLRELLLDAGGESYLERRFLRLVRQHGLPRPRCQVIFRSGKRTVARVDFAFGETVVVEVSGRLGHASDSDRRKDAHRRNELQQGGCHVVEFTTADVLDDPLYILTTVRNALDRSSSDRAFLGPPMNGSQPRRHDRPEHPPAEHPSVGT
jgi:very-short-patch-repair endonuclease